MEALSNLLSQLSGIVWGPPMVILLFGTHIFLTFRLGFMQKYIFRGIRDSVRKEPNSPGEVSPFGALTTALAATVGTGNIFGVAGAIAVGGPGALVWMWLTGVFGIATKYGECLLSVKYREKHPDGHYVGGPMMVLDKGLGMKPLAIVFAAFTAIAAFGIGNMVQSNTLAGMVDKISQDSSWFPHIPTWGTGLLLTSITAVVILGGIKSISKVCSVLVPFMALIYVTGCVIFIIMRIENMPSTFHLILTSAFKGQAAVGGFLGAGIAKTMQMGIARGLFSNEAGMGSAPIVAAAARASNPARQALIAATATFWDTVVICLLTGLVIVESGEWVNTVDKQVLSQLAFGHIPVLGPFILTFGLLTFVISTILGWSYYGERAMEYLFGAKSIFPYRIAWVVAVMVGSVVQIDVVWNFADVANALMTIPNLIGLLLLSGVIAKETREYFAK